MDRKGQMAMVGTIILLFVGIIVALSLYSGGITENVGTVTNTVTVVNDSYTFPAAGNTIVLKGQSNTNVAVVNASNGVSVASTNYTITNYDISTGSLRSTLTANAGIVGTFNSTAVKISSTYEPIGYAQESSTRSVVQLIAIFAGLAVLGFVIKKIYDDGLMDAFNFK